MSWARANKVRAINGPLEGPRFTQGRSNKAHYRHSTTSKHRVTVYRQWDYWQYGSAYRLPWAYLGVGNIGLAYITTIKRFASEALCVLFGLGYCSNELRAWIHVGTIIGYNNWLSTKLKEPLHYLQMSAKIDWASVVKSRTYHQISG